MSMSTVAILILSALFFVPSLYSFLKLRGFLIHLSLLFLWSVMIVECMFCAVDRLFLWCVINVNCFVYCERFSEVL